MKKTKGSSKPAPRLSADEEKGPTSATSSEVLRRETKGPGAPPSLEALAFALRSLGLSPEAVLERAVLGEVSVRQLEPGQLESVTGLVAARFVLSGHLRPLGAPPLAHREVLEALRQTPSTMFSVRVAESIEAAAWRCYYAPAREKVMRPRADVAFLLGLATALRTAHPLTESLTRARAAQSLAWDAFEKAKAMAESKPQRFAKPDGEPKWQAIAAARKEVAKAAGLSVEAMQTRIRRAVLAYPSATWPPIMPGSRKRRTLRHA